MRTQLCSIKPDIKDLQKVEQCHSSHYMFFVLEKKQPFFRKYVIYANLEWVGYCYFEVNYYVNVF